jgi:hypothetical protein
MASTYKAVGPYALTASQVEAIEGQVRYTLIDEESARFRNIRAAQVTNAEGEPEVVFCGEVNAKNRMGGFAGFRIFHGVITDGRPQLLDSTINVNGLLACREVL